MRIKKIKNNHQHNWEAKAIENNIKQLKRIILKSRTQKLTTLLDRVAPMPIQNVEIVEFF
jgi:hypothetical protein